MFKAEWSFGKEAFGPIAALRATLGIAGDAMDDYAAHVYVFDEDGSAIAAGRMYPALDAIRIDKLATAPERRALPYAEFTLRVILYKAKDLPQTVIEIVPTEDIAPLLPLFGFSKAENGLMSCPREGLVWFSQCKHEAEAKKS